MGRTPSNAVTSAGSYWQSPLAGSGPGFPGNPHQWLELQTPQAQPGEAVDYGRWFGDVGREKSWGVPSILSHTFPWSLELSRRGEMLFLCFSTARDTYGCSDMCQLVRENDFWIPSREIKADHKGSLHSGHNPTSAAHPERKEVNWSISRYKHTTAEKRVRSPPHTWIYTVPKNGIQPLQGAPTMASFLPTNFPTSLQSHNLVNPNHWKYFFKWVFKNSHVWLTLNDFSAGQTNQNLHLAVLQVIMRIQLHYVTPIFRYLPDF